ncbi:hypothetical protein HDV01_005722 [Terramyces sp. JEL0728]|nr:hypothetical protein HDV01_005722 [Terramyces sp. JEL0728]
MSSLAEFGTRKLENEEDVFEHNAWDNVEFDEEMLENAKQQVEKQKEAKLDEQRTIVELGCGAGNTVFPFLQERPDAFVYAFDYSSEAVNVVKSNELYDTTKCKAMVYDITSADITVEKESVDVVVYWKQASANIYNMLKPGGLLLFRDYGRMKKKRFLDDNFYCRGDGTRCYFFTNEELTEIFNTFEQ